MTATQSAGLAPDRASPTTLGRASRRVTARRDGLTALGFLTPYLVFFVLFLAYPFFWGIWISLHDWELVGSVRTFIGLLNYWDMFDDPLFQVSIRNTLLFTVMTVPVMVAVALGLALP